MKTIFFSSGLFLGLVLFLGQAQADTIYLKNGRSIEGFILEDNAETVVVDVGFGKVGLKRSEIDRINKSDETDASELREKWEHQKSERKKREQEEKLREEGMPREVSVGSDSAAFVVEVLLNNKVKASLILDTGATLVTITRNIADQLGIDVDAIKRVDHYTLADGSKKEAKRATVDSISVQGMEARNVEVSILEGKDPAPSLRDGLLGLSFLRNFNFKIDQKHKKLILEKVQ